MRFPALATLALFTGGGLVEGNVRLAVWLTGLALFLFATIQAGDSEWLIRGGHFAERHGLILIIALGEVIVAVGLPLVERLAEFDTIGLQTFLATAFAGVFAGLLFWSYFDRVSPAIEHRAEELTDRRLRGRFARDVYTYAHFFIVGGVILTAAALEEITLHPDEALDGIWRWMLFFGLSGFLGGVVGAVRRAYGVWARERLIAIAAIAALLVAAGGLNGFPLLVIINGVLLVTLVVEHRRIER